MGQQDGTGRHTSAEGSGSSDQPPAAQGGTPQDSDMLDLSAAGRHLWANPLVIRHRRRLAAALSEGVSQDVLAVRSYADLLAGSGGVEPERVAAVAEALRAQCDEL